MKQHLKAIVLFVGLSNILFAAADDGPRMYWNAPVGTNILQPFFWAASGNLLSPKSAKSGLDTDIDIGILSYSRIIDIAGHSAIPTVVILGGDVSGSYNDHKLSSASGFGDLYIQGTINIFGAPALSEKEFATYKQDTVLSFFVGVTAPTGAYDGDRLLNLGENRWNIHVGLPFMQTLGEWIPGEITTLEILPAVWFYGDNDNSFGSKIKQDPMYTLEAHITRDITTSTFVSVDYFVQRVGDSFTDGQQTGHANTSDSLGFTVGYMFNEQTQLQLRYASTLSPSSKDQEYDADMFQFNLNYFW